METEILKKLQEQEVKIDLMYKSVEKMRKYFMWTFILSLVFFILPLIGLMFVLPSVWNTLTGAGLL
jgi:TRAP-type mannitol/chloroaromatic compound transport system permease small subunit